MICSHVVTLAGPEGESPEKGDSEQKEETMFLRVRWEGRGGGGQNSSFLF